MGHTIEEAVMEGMLHGICCMRGSGRTTSLPRCEKHSSRRDHQEPGGNSSQTWRTTWVLSQLAFLSSLHKTAAFYGNSLGTCWCLVFFIYVLFWTKMSVFQVDSDQIGLMLSKLRHQHQNPSSFGVWVLRWQKWRVAKLNKELQEDRR